MTEEKRVIFNDVNDLVNYLFNKFGDLTPLKLQKGLYFLYAYYGAMYGEKEKEGVTEQNYNYPSRLFDSEFEAWTYGPVVREVYDNYKKDVYYENKISNEEADELFSDYAEAQRFVDELFGQIKEISDFSLVDRSHEDEAWRDPYKEQGKSAPMDNNKIIKEYREKL
ncbi:Panacea domain-containing protein [Alkalibacillus almallahensis]|uniref:Panacea domain-containing protein n=1 Tax=Alkalibacillus almallahensis TaxID=1379154 RepID=UPI00141F3723|nr:type II toxin-antitoxin system antitoxin SocA domain-containing protein [Alkalibacillus almallahensis]NIK12886.1 putative phage-associated protein [Alkalibacillus almallahensis]